MRLNRLAMLYQRIDPNCFFGQPAPYDRVLHVSLTYAKQDQAILFLFCSDVRCKLPTEDSGEDMTEPVVLVDPNLVADAERIIGAGLNAFNDEVTGVNV